MCVCVSLSHTLIPCIHNSIFYATNTIHALLSPAWGSICAQTWVLFIQQTILLLILLVLLLLFLLPPPLLLPPMLLPRPPQGLLPRLLPILPPPPSHTTSTTTTSPTLPQIQFMCLPQQPHPQHSHQQLQDIFLTLIPILKERRGEIDRDDDSIDNHSHDQNCDCD